MRLQENLFYSLRFKHFGIIEHDCGTVGAVLQVRHLVGRVFCNIIAPKFCTVLGIKKTGPIAS